MLFRSHHQQANGRAEAAVKVVKRLMEKAKVSGKDPNRALLAYCNTPQESMDTSPTQRFFGRRGKTDLPTTRTLLQPKGEWLCRSHKEDLKTSRMKAAYDKGAKDLDPLEEGESVRLRPTSMGSKVWVKARVLQRLDQRSYMVQQGDTLLDTPSGSAQGT